MQVFDMGKAGLAYVYNLYMEVTNLIKFTLRYMCTFVGIPYS